MQATLRFKNVRLLSPLISFLCIALVACGAKGPSWNSLALSYALNGAKDEDSPRAFLKVGRSLVIFAMFKLDDPLRLKTVIDGSELVFSSASSSIDDARLAHESTANHIDNLLAGATKPIWFKLPSPSDLKSIRSRQEMGKAVYYILDKDNVIWVYGSGDRWSS
jgi:hypothetical protein